MGQDGYRAGSGFTRCLGKSRFRAAQRNHKKKTVNYKSLTSSWDSGGLFWTGALATGLKAGGCAATAAMGTFCLFIISADRLILAVTDKMTLSTRLVPVSVFALMCCHDVRLGTR